MEEGDETEGDQENFYKEEGGDQKGDH